MKKKKNTGIIIAVIIFVVNAVVMLLLGVLSSGSGAEGSGVSSEVTAGNDVSEAAALDGNQMEEEDAGEQTAASDVLGNEDEQEPKNKLSEEKTEDAEFDRFEYEPELLKFSKYVATPTEYISLRKKAGYGSDIITKIKPGTVLQYLGEKREMGALFYKVRDTKSGRTGYVVSQYATPLSDTKYIEPKLSIVNAKDSTYTYEDMKKDIDALCKKYPKYLDSEVLGKSLDGRNMYKLTLGNPSAEKRILVEAGIHARESMSSVLVMGLVEYYCAHADNAKFQGEKYKKFLSEYAFDIVPMVNPDGVDLELLGLKGIHSSEYKKTIRECYARDKKYLRYNSGAGTWYDIRTTKGINIKKELKKRHKVISLGAYLKIWKANARGVDLNRNFDAEWEALKLKEKPSFEKYKGTAPESEPEAKILADLLRENDYMFQLSYHTSGQVIYYDVPGNTRFIRSQSINRAIWFRQFTGYTPVSEVSASDQGGLDLGGFADWAMSRENVPALCVELGLGTSPVKASEFRTIFMQNRESWMAFCYYQNLLV